MNGVLRRRISHHLAEHDYLDGPFSAGDLLMVTVLRRLGTSNLLEEQPRVSAFVARGEARPAFQAAFAAQLAIFTQANK